VQVLREIAIMRKLDHVNVVNMHDVIDDVFANKLYMVIDFCKARRRRRRRRRAAAAWAASRRIAGKSAARCTLRAARCTPRPPCTPRAPRTPAGPPHAPARPARPPPPRSTAPSWTRTRCRAARSS